MIKRILHSTGSVWVSEEEIKVGNKYFITGGIGRNIGIYIAIQADKDLGVFNNEWCKKIIAQTNHTLDGISYIELPEEEDVEKLTKQLINEYGKLYGDNAKFIYGYNEGYKAASKNKKYSEEDMRKAFKSGYEHSYEILKYPAFTPNSLNEDKFIQSLTPKSNDDIIGCELVMHCTERDSLGIPNGSSYKSKTYINQAGQTCLEVKQWIRK